MLFMVKFIIEKQNDPPAIIISWENADHSPCHSFIFADVTTDADGLWHIVALGGLHNKQYAIRDEYSMYGYSKNQKHVVLIALNTRQRVVCPMWKKRTVRMLNM